MKTTILTFATLAFLALFFACNHKKAQDTKDKAKEEIAEVPDEQDKAEEQPATEVYQTVGFKKTACFGKCPVYEVKFFTNNTATWHGKMNVDRKGHYEAKLGENAIKNIREKAAEVHYFDFYNEYPVEHKVADLPSTITFLRIGDIVKTVKNTHEGPAKLAEFEAYLENIINSLDWKAVAND